MIDLRQTVEFLTKGIDGTVEALEGGYRIGHTPHVAPRAYLYRIYPPLNDVQMTALATEMPLNIPDDFIRFLRVANGARLFGGVMSVQGYISNLSRSVEGLGQPISLRYGNVFREIGGLGETDFAIGGLVGASRQLYLIMNETGLVHALTNEGATVRTWPDFATFWNDELNRLSPFFDRSGRLVTDKDNLLVFDRQ